MIKTNVMRILEKAQIPFQFYEYDPKTGVDALSVAKYLNKPAEIIFKTLVVISSQHEYFVFVVPANSELDLKKAAKTAGVKSVEMLPLKKLLPTTGYVHGGCSPIGMKKQYPTYINDTCLNFDKIAISAGICGCTLIMTPNDLLNVTKATAVDLVK